MPESAWPHPQVPYAVSKLAAEHYIFALGELNGIETVALRIFNAYGPGQRIPPAHAPVVPHFAKNVLERRVGGRPRRRQPDARLRLYRRCGGRPDCRRHGPDVNRQVINVGSGQETSINALIATLGQVTQRQPEVIYNPQQSGGIARLVADLGAARAVAGLSSPRYRCREGLERLLAEDPRLPGHANRAETAHAPMAVKVEHLRRWHANVRCRSRESEEAVDADLRTPMLPRSTSYQASSLPVRHHAACRCWPS